MLDGQWLDQPAITLFDDRARADKVIRLCQARRRTLAAEQLEQRLLEQAHDEAAGRPVKPAVAPLDAGYEATYKALAEAVKFVGTDAGERTIRRVLESVGGAGAGEIVGDLMLLERRDEGWRRVLDRELGPLMLERVDQRGQVLLDQGDASAVDPTMTSGGCTVVPLRADIGKVLADPQEFERRLARARATGGYDGTDAAREKFATRDRQEAEAGIDHVRTLERPRELAAARAKANGAALQLDNAVAQGSDHDSKLFLLEAELAKLGAAAARSPAPATEPAPDVRLLERPNAAGAQSPPADPRLLEASAYASAIVLARGEQPGDGMAYLRALDQVYSDHPELVVASWEQPTAGLRLLETPAPTKAPPARNAAPPGVYGPSHDMHERVQKRLEAEGLPQSQYLRLFDQMLAEGR
jgi:hypothetical protein